MGWVGLVKRDERDDKRVEFLVEWRITYSARRAVVFFGLETGDWSWTGGGGAGWLKVEDLGSALTMVLSLLTVKNVRNSVAGRYCRGSSMDTRVNDMVCVGRRRSNCPKHLV